MLEKPVLDVIQEKYSKIFSAEKKVADFVINHPQEAVNSNVTELAKKSGVSDATVVRMCRHLGYKGYYQFRLMLAKDIGRDVDINEEIELQQELNPVVKIFEQYANSIMSVGANLNVDEFKQCANLIKSSNNVHVIAVGNTMPLALYAGFRLERMGVHACYDVLPEYFLNHINLANPNDIVLAISQSGSSRQIVQGMELAKKKGLKRIAITGYRQSQVSLLADHILVSNEKNESFNYYKNYAHLKETAVIDALLAFVMNLETIAEKDANLPEMIMSEYKY